MSRNCADLLEDEDALRAALLALLGAHPGPEGSTRELVAVELEVVRARLDALDAHGRALLDHALDILERAHEDSAVALATKVLRDVSRPPLDEVVLAEPQGLGDALDAVIRNDRAVCRLTRRVLRLQERLRARVSERTWGLFLRVEEAMTARAAAAQAAAYAEGRRASAATAASGAREARSQEHQSPQRGGAQ